MIVGERFEFLSTDAHKWWFGTPHGGTFAEVGYGRLNHFPWSSGALGTRACETLQENTSWPPPRTAQVLRSSLDIFMYPNGLCNFYWSNWSCTKDHGCYVRCGGCIHIYIYAFVCILHMFLHIVDVLNVFKRWAQMHLVPGISGALQPPNRCAAPEGSGMLSIDAKQRNHHCYGLLGFCWHPSFMVAMLLLNSQCCCWMLLIHIVIPTFCRICDMSLSFSVIILLYPSSSGAYINLHPSLSFLT